MKATLFSALLVLVACDDADPCATETPNTVCTIAGGGVQKFDARFNGPATKASLYWPIDLAVSPQGELWVIDFNNYLIRAIDDDGIIRTVVGNGMVGTDPPPGVERVPALEATGNHMTDLLFSGDYLYLAAWHNSQVKRVRLSDMTYENYAGRGVRTDYDGDGGPARDAALDLPSALAIDPAGNLTVMDQANQVIRQIDGNGAISTIAGTCVVDDEVHCAEPVACGGGSHKLVCGDPAMYCDYPCIPRFAGDGGPARDARFALPYGATAGPAGHLAYTRDGDLLFADTNNHRIRRIDARSGIVTTIAGIGGGEYTGDGGPAVAAQLNGPVDLAIAPDGSIYFTDVQNNCVRKIDPSGIISTAAGRCSPNPVNRGFEGDGGPPLDAMFDRPYGIALDGDKLYVADAANNRVRRVMLPR